VQQEAERMRAYRRRKAASTRWREAERARRLAAYAKLAADPAWREQRNEKVRGYRARRRALEATVVEPGATLDELAERSGRPLSELAAVMASEVALGRVLQRPDGRFLVVGARFSPAVLDALRALSAPDVAALANGHRSRANGDRRLTAAEWANLSYAYY
jgi:hypothetical protein